MRRWLLSALALSLAGCSWSRFDDISENAPIVVLTRPKTISGGFGSSLSSSSVDDSVRLLVGGSPLRQSGATFELGEGDDPGVNAADSGYCGRGGNPDDVCYLAASTAALTRADTPGMERTQCFATGSGRIDDRLGVVVRCADKVEYTLEVPSRAEKVVSFAIEEDQPEQFYFAADASEAPLLLASNPASGTAWFYASLDRDFVELPSPLEGDLPSDFGATLGVARLGEGDGRLLAVGSPEAGRVDLYAVPDGRTPEYVGCVGGSDGFGRALASGAVLEDASDDALVVSDEERVYVLDAGKLAALEPATDGSCQLEALPDGAVVAELECETSGDVSGCEGAEFGAALAVGDLDGDEDGEVVVGAPRLGVRGTSRAGALFTFDVERSSDESVADIAFISSAEDGDQLGRSLTLPRIDGRNIIAAGAPSNGKVALFYCPSFLPEELAGPRCK